MPGPHVGVPDFFKSMDEIFQRATSEKKPSYHPPAPVLSCLMVNGSTIERAIVLSFDRAKATVTLDVGAVLTVPVNKIERYVPSILYVAKSLPPDPEEAIPVRYLSL